MVHPPAVAAVHGVHVLREAGAVALEPHKDISLPRVHADEYAVVFFSQRSEGVNRALADEAADLDEHSGGTSLRCTQVRTADLGTSHFCCR